MSDAQDLIGIQYPDRAEGVGRYKDYKVFVDFWEPLTDHLSEQFRKLYLRSQTRILGIFGEQGSGKTLFSTQLLEDHSETQGSKLAKLDSENLWHRVAQGAGATPAGVQEATDKSICDIVPDELNWVETIKGWRGAAGTPIIAIADNAETEYFLRGLVGDRFPNATRTNEAYLDLAAENLVKQTRKPKNGLEGVLLIMLSNDRAFLDAFKRKVDSQHKDLMEVLDLPMPSAREKERAVRVNVNRLNRVSYWYCLDRGGDQQRKAVRDRLIGATTFPGAFDAVDLALRYGAGRTGRPAKKNLLSLTCFVKQDEISLDSIKISDDFVVEAHHKWAASILLNSGWAHVGGLSDQSAALLESEWQLRVVALGEPFVAALLAAEVLDDLSSEWYAHSFEYAGDMLRLMQTVLGPTSKLEARTKFKEDVARRVDNWLPDVSPARADLDDFWARGQNRSQIYEDKLRQILGTYNQTTAGFMAARPDYVVEDFSPAALTAADKSTSPAITRVIQRNAHAVEFTSQISPSVSSINDYLSLKLPNYLIAMREQ